MNMMNKQSPERQEIEALLPWHAAGTLSRRDSERVETALAGDHDLQRCYEVVREELNETIHLNETLGAPSARAIEKLFARINAEAPIKRRASFSLSVWLADLITSFSPRTLAYSATAAALAILVQGAVLTAVVFNKDPGASETVLASHESGERSLAMVRFAPQANAVEITRLLNAYKAQVVDGPNSAGFYSIRLTKDLAQDELNRVIKQIQDESKVVDFIATK
jgi:anti-sigma-K factor RskA